MAKRQAKRQRVRKLLLLVSLLLFPITIYYFSPYIIIDGAAQGIINGSFVLFGLMFLSALFVGRVWCGWACPAGGLQEFGTLVTDKPARGGKADWIKWGIWIPWIAIIAIVSIAAGGYHAVNVFHLLEGGISVAEPAAYVVYYVIIALFLVPSLVVGRRAGCHYLCWMAPFMIIGRKIRNFFRWPALRLKVDEEKCVDCKLCTKNCPMSLDVMGMVHRRDMENSECILCGTCVGICPKDVLRYSLSAGRSAQ